MLIVKDDFFEQSMVYALSATWPDIHSPHWHIYNDANSTKLASRSWDHMPRMATFMLNELATLNVDKLLNLQGSFADIEGLNGAGLHYMLEGSHLGLHTDAAKHPIRPWRRVASAVLYLDNCEGGELQFDDEVVIPKFNRLALFTTENNRHRVTECRSKRRSLCMFYWKVDYDATGNTCANFFNTASNNVPNTKSR